MRGPDRACRPGALHVLLGGPAQPYPKRLPVYFASGGSMTASGILYPRGPFLFQLLEPLEVGGLTSVARPLSGPPSSGRVRVLYRGTEPGEAAGLLLTSLN